MGLSQGLSQNYGAPRHSRAASLAISRESDNVYNVSRSSAETLAERGESSAPQTSDTQSHVLSQNYGAGRHSLSVSLAKPLASDNVSDVSRSSGEPSGDLAPVVAPLFSTELAASCQAALSHRLPSPDPQVNQKLVICAWCPDFDPTAHANRGVSHGMCPSCSAKLHAEMDALGFAK